MKRLLGWGGPGRSFTCLGKNRACNFLGLLWSCTHGRCRGAAPDPGPTRAGVSLLPPAFPSRHGTPPFPREMCQHLPRGWAAGRGEAERGGRERGRGREQPGLRRGALRCRGSPAWWEGKRETVVWRLIRLLHTVNLGTICTLSPPPPPIHPSVHPSIHIQPPHKSPPLTKRLSNHNLLWQPAGINAIKRVFNGLIDWSRYHV